MKNGPTTTIKFTKHTAFGTRIRKNKLVIVFLFEVY